MGDRWHPVTLGCSDAEVLRSPDGRHHAKRVHGATAVAALAAERDRQEWLAGVGVEAPRVADWSEADGGATLVSTTVPGMPASAVTASDADRAVPGIARLLGDLHAVTAPCPFDRRLPTVLAQARHAVATGAVDVDDLDDDRRGRSPADLLTELERRAGGRTEDVVLCHGDASLPNLFLDERTLRPTGIVDVGGLGLADRYLDLALVVRSLADDRNLAFQPQHVSAFWMHYGIDVDAVDHDAVDFYQLLDEFF